MPTFLNCDLPVFESDLPIVAIRNSIRTDDFFCHFYNLPTFLYSISQKLLKLGILNKYQKFYSFLMHIQYSFQTDYFSVASLA